MKEERRKGIGSYFRQLLNNCGGNEENDQPANNPPDDKPSNDFVTADNQESLEGDATSTASRTLPPDSSHTCSSRTCADNQPNTEAKKTTSVPSLAEKQPDKSGEMTTDLPSSIKRMQEQLAVIQASLQNRTAIQEFINGQGLTLKMMSERLRTLEDDFVQERMMKPLFKEVLVAYDDIIKAAKSLKDVSSADTARNILEGIAIQILQMLERHSITALHNTPAIFDPTCQKALAVVSIKSVKAGTVISREQTGFTFGGKVFRYEGVIIVGE